MLRFVAVESCSIEMRHLTIPTTIKITTLFSNYSLFFDGPFWRIGGNTLRKRSRVRFPHSANICVYEHVFVLGLGVSMYNMYVFTKNVYKYIIRYLEYITQAL
jgi:hypothetical protein